MNSVLTETLQSTTVWSFPKRAMHATHSAGYRGNWAPQVANNIIRLYSKEGETVLDPMVGSGTTLIEAKLLGRKGIGFDIHSEVVKLAKIATQFKESSPLKLFDPEITVADAAHMASLDDESIDLIATHPPYLNIIKYGEREREGDLSRLGSISKFCDRIEIVAKECFRVLKPNKYCAILIGDTRRRRHYVPLAFNVMQRFLRVGFILKEDVIKEQHNCGATRYWNAQKKDFLLIMHEHLFVFRKPSPKDNIAEYKNSCLSENWGGTTSCSGNT